MIERRFQNYRGTWAWLAQRISAIGLFLIIPVKIYTGWAAMGKVPAPRFLEAGAIHIHWSLDVVLLLLFLVHGFYGLRVILIDVGWIRGDAYFWRTLGVATAVFGAVVWFVYLRRH